MANVFDQFDQQSNPFDQFDAPSAVSQIPVGEHPETTPDNSDWKSKIKAADEAAKSVIGGLVSYPLGVVGAGLSTLNKAGTGKFNDINFLKEAEDISAGLTPQSDNKLANSYAEDVMHSGAMQSLNAFGAIAHHTLPPVRRLKAPEEPQSKVAETIAAEKVNPFDQFDEVKPPMPTEGQGELLPSNAPQYGINHDTDAGMWTTGDTGTGLETNKGQWVDQTPFRADLSMDVENMQNPLQRNLFGEDMTPAAGAERTLAQSMDQMADKGGLIPEAVNKLKEGVPTDEAMRTGQYEAGNPAREGPFSIPKEQRGAIDLGLQNNASGESAASLEAQGRLRQEQTLDRPRYVIRKDGSVTPLIGVDAVDYHPKQGEVVIQKGIGKNDFTVLDSQAKNPQASLGRARSQLGGVNYELLVPKKIRDFVDNWIKAGGTTYIGAIRRMVEDNNVQITPMQRELLKQEFPETVKQYKPKIDNYRDDAQQERWEKRLDNALITDAVGREIDWYGKFRPDQQDYIGSNKYAQARQDAANLLNKIKPPKSQLGGIINPFGGREATQPMQSKLPKEDSVQRPTSEATIEEKQQTAAKLKALALDHPEYSRVQTVEEAKALALQPDRKDISKNKVRDATISGVNGMVMSNPKNPLLNGIRTWLQDAANATESFSKSFVTGKDGIVQSYRKMKSSEWNLVAEALNEASKQKVGLSESVMNKLGMNENQKDFVRILRKALDEFYNMANDANMKLGFEPFKYIEGYLPGMFTGGYKALVGYTEQQANGKSRFVVKAVAQADTKIGLNAALDYYKTGGTQFAEVIPMKRSSLRDTVMKRNSAFDGFADIVQTIAAHDPEFAELKARADEKMKQKMKSLYAFDVHELNKKGVEGGLGNKPWLDRNTNSKELLEGVIDYLETGSKYYNYQEALNNAGKLTSDPALQAKMPNTLSYITDHVEHVTGRNLSQIGGALNFIIDSVVAKPWGVSYKVPSAAVHELKNIMSIYMMGTYNPAFFMTQLTQYFTGGGPEAAKLASVLGTVNLPAKASAQGTYFHLMMMENGGIIKNAPVPANTRAAFNWAKEHGMFNFSEMELAHQALKNPLIARAENLASIPMAWGERLTRPAVFMTFADMFNDYGLPGEDGFKIAQLSTQFAMGDYGFDERPHIYASLGVTGHFMGALTTYKHNYITQQVTRTKDVKRGHVAPILHMVAMAALLQGVTGQAGYDEMDKIVKWSTEAATGVGRSIRELAFGSNANKPSYVMDGIASAASDIDFQNRLSISHVVPDQVGSALSPQLSALGNILMKAARYGTYRDEQSKNDLMYTLTPQGMKGFTEDAVRRDMDDYVLNKAGQRTQQEPRSQQEWSTRKWLGIRPLRERLEGEDVYLKSQQESGLEERRKELSSRMNAAIVQKDWEAYNRFAKLYRDAQGNPETPYATEKIENANVEAKKSERLRKAGTPTDYESARKFQRFYNND